MPLLSLPLDHAQRARVPAAPSSNAGSTPPLARHALEAGEALHADLPTEGWRYHAVDVTYTEPRVVAIGGPLMLGLAAVGSAVARRRARREEEALAAPQWRPLGALRILATDRRLLVWHEGAWASVRYDAIRELHLDLDLEVGRLDVTFANDAPYCLAGP